MANWYYYNHYESDTVDSVVEKLLKNRQITSFETFFNPPPPREWDENTHGITKSHVDQFRQIVNNNQGEILIYGDYDADGILASAIMASVVEEMGHEVSVYIPDRHKDGYGMSVNSLKEIIDKHSQIKLVITVDQGIKAIEAVKFLKQSQIKVVITDHHTPDATLPSAELIVHSTQVCGSAVAYFLTRYLATKPLNEINLQLAAIGTVTDVMPLTDINRNIVHHGLKYLRNTNHHGIKAILDLAKIETSSLDTYHLGFQLGPRLNAEGRIGDSMKPYKVLTASTYSKAMEYAQSLNITNQNRQEITQLMLTHALENSDTSTKIIIASSKDYDEGIIGLIAGKLTQNYYRPAIAINIGPQISKGSVRSVKDVNVVDMLDKVGKLLLNYGGHPLAGGFTLPTSQLENFINSINKIGQKIPDDLLKKTINIDTIIPFDLINSELVSVVNQFAPFGHGNHKPIFVTKNLEVISTKTIGKENHHLKLLLKHNQTVIECLAWGIGEQVNLLQPKTKLDVAYTLKSTMWRGTEQINIELIDYHLI